MKPGSTIKVRYQKLGREGVLDWLDLDTGEITPTRGSLPANCSARSSMSASTCSLMTWASRTGQRTE